jgi:hypothetical protein
VQRSATDAFALGRLQLEYADIRLCLKPAGQLLKEAIVAYAQRSGQPGPYLPLTGHEQEQWRALAPGRASLADVESIVTEATVQVQAFLDVMQEAWPEAKADYVAHKKGGGKFPKFQDLWPSPSLHHAEGFAKRVGALRAAHRRGLKGLLARRRELAAAGAGVRLIYAQAITGEKPDRADSRDTQHVVIASAVGRPFVTRYKRIAPGLAGGNRRGSQALK